VLAAARTHEHDIEVDVVVGELRTCDGELGHHAGDRRGRRRADEDRGAVHVLRA
jgi:hypothetical protein